jgi:hypothetical protein
MKYWFVVLACCMGSSVVAGQSRTQAPGLLAEAILDAEEAVKKGKDGDANALAAHADAASQKAGAAATAKNISDIRKAATLLKLAAFHGRHGRSDIAVREAEAALSRLNSAMSGASPPTAKPSDEGAGTNEKPASPSQGARQPEKETVLSKGQPVKSRGPEVDQEFQPWQGLVSPDNIWRIAGVWIGTGGNVLDPALASLTSTYKGQPGGFLSLSVKANSMRGSEIQSLPSYGYGYYETRMKVTSEPGVCASFFWIQAPYYGPHEWDVEFLTNEPWISSPNSGKVHLTIHPSKAEYVVDLPFNPSRDFHRYGFLWTAQTIAFTVDGQIVHTFSDSSLKTDAKGFIMMNTWTGSPTWGGGPPVADATTHYDWVRFWPDATAVPD